MCRVFLVDKIVKYHGMCKFPITGNRIFRIIQSQINPLLLQDYVETETGKA